MSRLITAEIDLIDPSIAEYEPTAGATQVFEGQTTIYRTGYEPQTFESEIEGTVASIQIVKVPSEHEDAEDGFLNVKVVRLVDGTVIASHDLIEIAKPRPIR